MSYYEALSDSKDRTSIPLFSLAIKAVLQSFNRERLAFLGRYLYDNDGIVAYAVDQIANYSVPITPMAASANPEANKTYETYFANWSKRADYTGRFTFDSLQRLICKAIDTDGDIGATLNASHGFPQVQLLETWRINSRLVQDKNIKHMDGVRIDGEGAIQGFFIVEAANILGSALIGDTPPQFIPASQAVLLYDADRYSSYRGITPIRRGMNDVRDAKDIKSFEKLATKIGAALAAVIEGGIEEEDVWGDDTGPDGNAPPTEDPAKPPTQHEKKITVAELLGGDIVTLPEGKKLHQLDNTRPGERVMEMLDYLGGCFVSGLGVPPSFFLVRKMTGPNQRNVNGQAQRKFNQRQELIAAFVEWVWVRVIAWGIQYDGLPVVDGWDKIEWQGPPKVSIDEGADAAAWRDDVACGLMTRQEHYSNRARNWQRETDQGFAEDDYILTKANQLATKQKVPVETILARWGYTPAKPAQNPQSTKPNEADSPPAD
jgi:capsid protein